LRQIQANLVRNINFRDGTTLEKEERATAPGQPVRPAVHGSKHKQLLVTIAIAGIAVLIGSILYQKRGVTAQSLLTKGWHKYKSIFWFLKMYAFS
jgi:hypothetical protein